MSKKTLVLYACLSILTACGMVFTACTHASGGIPNATGVTLSPQTLSMEVGGEPQQLTATVSPAKANQSVKWESSDDSIAMVDDDGIVTAIGAGTAVITVKTLDEIFSDTCDVTVTEDEITLTGIDVTTPPTKITYHENDKFNPAGMVVTASYSDSSEEIIAHNLLAIDFDSSEAGEITVTVTYGGKSATFTVTVDAISLTGIEVTTLPTKTTYHENDGFNPAGMVVTASYSDGSSDIIDNDLLTIEFNSSEAGEITVTVTYEGKSDTLTVTVDAVTLTGIEVTTQPTEKSYFVGDTLDLTGLVVTASYSDSSEEIIANNLLAIDPETFTTAGENITVTVTYGGKSATFTVTVSPNTGTPTLTKIEVTTLPDKQTYFVGASLNLAGMEVTGTYSEGDPAIIPNSNFDFAYDFSSTGTKTVTVTFKGTSITTTFTVTVEALPDGIAELKVDFEDAIWSHNTYNTPGKNVTFESLNWLISGVSNSMGANDRYNGSKSIRLRGDTDDVNRVELIDYLDGIESVSFDYGRYGTDANGKIALWYKLEGSAATPEENDWVKVGEDIAVPAWSGTMETATYDFDGEDYPVLDQPVRIKIQAVAVGGTIRTNIDDIVIMYRLPTPTGTAGITFNLDEDFDGAQTSYSLGADQTATITLTNYADYAEIYYILNTDDPVKVTSGAIAIAYGNLPKKTNNLLIVAVDSNGFEYSKPVEIKKN